MAFDCMGLSIAPFLCAGPGLLRVGGRPGFPRRGLGRRSGRFFIDRARARTYGRDAGTKSSFFEAIPAAPGFPRAGVLCFGLYVAGARS